MPRAPASALPALIALLAAGCDTPSTNVVLDNEYSPAFAAPYVVYDAFWQAVEWKAPVPPGTSSDPLSTIAASANTAYVLVAPGWDPTSSATPSSYLLLQSRDGFGAHVNDTLRIPLNDMTFVGNCAAGSHLSRAQADFMTQLVFASELGSLHYDVATCTVIGAP